MKIWLQLKKIFKSKDKKTQLVKFRKFPDWKLGEQIGHGTFANVHLLQKKDRRLVVKIVDTTKHQEEMEAVQVECLIHRHLHHRNIIELMDWEVQGHLLYMFVQYAAGGSVLDKINEISTDDAHRYFQQLIEGVEFLHRYGIAHRDLKPANLLIDDVDTLKIADFGLAAVFRRGEESMPLADICGTPAYMAPEVFSGHYDGEAADVWSCGVILVNLLTRQAPWDEAKESCKSFASWSTSQDANGRPWAQMDDAAFDLARHMLQPEPQKRTTIEQIKGSEFIYLNSY